MYTYKKILNKFFKPDPPKIACTIILPVARPR